MEVQTWSGACDKGLHNGVQCTYYGRSLGVETRSDVSGSEVNEPPGRTITLLTDKVPTT